jgi:hypothetical protein
MLRRYGLMQRFSGKIPKLAIKDMLMSLLVTLMVVTPGAVGLMVLVLAVTVGRAWLTKRYERLFVRMWYSLKTKMSYVFGSQC